MALNELKELKEIPHDGLPNIASIIRKYETNEPMPEVLAVCNLVGSFFTQGYQNLDNLSYTLHKNITIIV